MEFGEFPFVRRLHRSAKASPTRGGGIKRSEDDGEVVWKDGLPIECGVFWLRHNLHPAAPAPLLMHDHLPVDAVLQGGDMGDDAHQSVAFGQAGEHPDGLFQRFLIQRAEALIEEEGVQPDAACGALDFIGKAQGQRQRGLEALAAGQGLDTAAGCSGR